MALFVQFVTASVYFGTSRHCKGRENTQMTNQTSLTKLRLELRPQVPATAARNLKNSQKWLREGTKGVFQSPQNGAGKLAPRGKCQKLSKIFLTLFDDFWRFLPCAKSLEKCRKYLWHFLTIFDVAPFRWPLFAVRWVLIWRPWPKRPFAPSPSHLLGNFPFSGRCSRTFGSQGWRIYT